MSLVLACDFKDCHAAVCVSQPNPTGDERTTIRCAPIDQHWLTLRAWDGATIAGAYHFCPEHAALLRADQWPRETPLVATAKNP